MEAPSDETLAGMGLLSKSQTVTTEFISLREDTKRRDYYDKFTAAYANVEEFSNIRWCTDSTPANVSCRCNGNICLLEIGAIVPAAGQRGERTIPGEIVYQRRALGD